MTKRKLPHEKTNARCPRTVSPAPNIMIKLGEEMVSYVMDRKNKVIHISQWWSGIKCFTSKQWETMKDRPEFMPYYERCMRVIANKYIDGTINPSIAQRFLRMYFGDLKKIENEDAKANADLRKEIEGVKPTHVTVRVTNDGLGSGLNISAEAVSDPVDKSSQ